MSTLQASSTLPTITSGSKDGEHLHSSVIFFLFVAWLHPSAKFVLYICHCQFPFLAVDWDSCLSCVPVLQRPDSCWCLPPLHTKEVKQNKWTASCNCYADCATTPHIGVGYIQPLTCATIERRNLCYVYIFTMTSGPRPLMHGSTSSKEMKICGYL